MCWFSCRDSDQVEIRFRRIEYLSCKIDTNLRMEEEKKRKRKCTSTRINVGGQPSRVEEKFLIAIEYPCKNRNMDLMERANVIYLHEKHKKLIL